MDILKIVLDKDYMLSVVVSPYLVLAAVGLVAIFVLAKALLRRYPLWRDFELDEAEFGIGNGKFKLRPNDTDKQIAYKIWVELSTRKIGLPIELDNDVIVEVYDSWYGFFGVTRELIKEVPVSKFRRKDTERIIRASIDVLNSGIRPHLTKWQARFRRWYDAQLTQETNAAVHPQDIQRKYPEFDLLSKDLMDVNRRLIGYRNKMYELISGL